MEKSKASLQEAEAAARAVMRAELARQQEAVRRQRAREARAERSRRTFPLGLLGMAVGALVGHLYFGSAARGAQIGLVAGFTAALVVWLPADETVAERPDSDASRTAGGTGNG